MTQKKMIIEYMEKNGGITSMEAFRDLGITRLASRIHDLTVDGYDIVRTDEVSINRYGETTRFTRYSLAKEESA